MTRDADARGLRGAVHAVRSRAADKVYDVAFTVALGTLTVGGVLTVLGTVAVVLPFLVVADVIAPDTGPVVDEQPDV